jgi:exodeoxyribonuclease III
MKIATFNINDVNKRLGNLIGWLRAEKPDVVALQELKAADREFPKAAIEKAGYGGVWRGQKTWNGVAILARGCADRDAARIARRSRRQPGALYRGGG